MKNSIKKIVIPIDGSGTASGSLDYLDTLYGPKHDLEIILLQILPALPSVLIDDTTKTIDENFKIKVRAVERKNIQLADRTLTEAKRTLCAKGFDENRITTYLKKMDAEPSYDICEWAKTLKADAILMNRRGRTNSIFFNFGSITNGLVASCVDCPVAIAEGGIRSKKALVFFDNAENGFRAVNHASFMLSGTGCQITLFHPIWHLRRFVPSEVLDEISGLEEVWRERALRYMEPNIEKAKETFLQAGFPEKQITVKVIEGSENAVNDILKETRNDDFGMIILGRRGVSAVREFFLEYSVGKILTSPTGTAIWVV
jgi:nucleotide-binding universal stress UspA family protein